MFGTRFIFNWSFSGAVFTVKLPILRSTFALQQGD